MAGEREHGGERWLHCEPEISGALLQPLLRFYRQQLGAEASQDLADALGTSLSVLEDPDRWYSVELFRELYEAMVQATGDPNIVYKAGRAITQPGVMGPQRSILRALLSVRGVLGNWSGLDQSLRRGASWNVQFKALGTAVATFGLEEGARDDIELCRHRRGILESIPELFDLPPSDVIHPECIHRGDSHCVYEVRWLERPNILRTAIGMTILSSVGALALYLQDSPYSLLLTGSAVAMFFVSFISSLAGPRGTVGQAESLSERHVAELRDLLDRNRRRVQELQAVGSVATATRGRLNEDGLLSAVLEALRTHLGYSRVMLLLVMPGQKVLGGVRARGFGKSADLLGSLEVELQVREEEPARLFSQILLSGQPILVRDVTALKSVLQEEDLSLLSRLGSTSFVASPVIGGSEPLGLIYVDRTNNEEGDSLTLRDAELLGNIGATLGAALSNSRLFSRVQEELLINRKFRHYLPPHVVDEIRVDPQAALQLGGQEEELAIMLADIADFTTIAERLSAMEVVKGLNTWFGIADPLIAQCGGIVDKRMGDGILIVFRPEEGDRLGRHPVERAAAAAVGMRRALSMKRDEIEKDAPGFADMKVRYAIHYGRVTMGNFGSDHKMEYTVIGAAVNTCARLEELTPAGEIWVTGEAVQAAGDEGLYGAEFEDEFVLRGHERVTEVFSISIESQASNTGTWSLAEIPAVAAAPLRNDAG